MTITQPPKASSLEAGTGPRRPRRPRTPGSRASVATGRAGSCPTPRSSSASTPPTSGSASAPASSSRAGPPTASRSSTCRAAARGGPRGGRASRARPSTPSSSPRSAPYQTPAAAPSSRTRSAAPRWPFDISAACAGYCHGIALANDLVRGGTAEHVLVIGVERLSDFTGRDDRGTAFIFGDGAGAAVVSPSETPGIGPTDLGLRRRQVGRHHADRSPGSTSTTQRQLQLAGHRHGRASRCSAGRSGAWPRSPSRRSTPPAITVDQLDAFIPHQANMRIIDAMVKQLKLPADVAGRPRHRLDRQHLRGLDPAGDGAACCAERRGAQRRPRPADRLRRRVWSTRRRSSSSPERITLPSAHGYPGQHAPPTKRSKEHRNGTE